MFSAIVWTDYLRAYTRSVAALNPPFWTTPARVSGLPSWTMARLSRLGRGWLEEHLAADGLRLAHYATLETLDAYGELSQRELASATGYDPSDMVAVLDQLQDSGLVQRARDATDRRRQLAGLTPDGRAALTRARAGADEAAERLLAPLTTAQARTFMKMLTTLVRAHESADPTPKD